MVIALAFINIADFRIRKVVKAEQNLLFAGLFVRFSTTFQAFQLFSTSRFILLLKAKDGLNTNLAFSKHYGGSI